MAITQLQPFNLNTTANYTFANITTDNANLGNAATANFFIGSGNNLSNIQGANVTGAVSSATTAGTVTTNAQPNITSVGTLSSLTVTGNITGSNLVTAGKVYSSEFINGGTGIYLSAGPSGYINFFTTGGDKASISDTGNIIASNLIANSTVFATTANISGNINAGNVYANSGTIGASLLTGTVTTNAQPNITSVGTLSNLTVTGNVTAGNINAGNLLTANFIAGTLTTAAQGNITSLGILSSLTATGNISGGNLITGGIVSATGNGTFGNVSATTFTGALSGAATTAGTVTTNAQPNITSVGSLTGLIVSNATGIVDFTTTANVTLGSVSNLHISGGSAGQVLTTNGSNTLSWTTSAGTTITDDTTTNASYYLTFANATSGTLSTAFVSSTKSYFNPSTGQLNATDFNSLSDINYKTNIKPLTDAKSTILLMTGVSFDWVDGTGSSYGFIAQDLEQIIPHVVSTNQNGAKSVNYSAIIPFLVETVKQQQQQIDNLTTIVNKIVDADY